MMRVCHLNTCPVGVATQDPALRERFDGQPEHVVNYLLLVAEEARELMASLGVRTIDELIGRTEPAAQPTTRSTTGRRAASTSRRCSTCPTRSARGRAAPPHARPRSRCSTTRSTRTCIEEALPARSTTATACGPRGRSRTRTAPSAACCRARSRACTAPAGWPRAASRSRFEGSAGQSFGAWLAPGVTLDPRRATPTTTSARASPAARVVVRPHRRRRVRRRGERDRRQHRPLRRHERQGLLPRLAGERFAVRNSGVSTVVEGVGDHGCEYMTGGRVVVIGPTGLNFAAGMSGGVAYVHDPRRTLPRRAATWSWSASRISAATTPKRSAR